MKKTFPFSDADLNSLIAALDALVDEYPDHNMFKILLNKTKDLKIWKQKCGIND